MRHLTKALLLIATLTFSALAQNPQPAEQRAEELRGQLHNITEKQAELQGQLTQLEEDLKPENIQLSIAGIGTTDAGALRDQRRQQLERKKANVEGQLRSLDESRVRLEASIASAESEAVRMRANALGPSNAPQQAGTTNTTITVTPPLQKKTIIQTKKRRSRKARARAH